MNEWMNEWVSEWVSEWMNEWMNEAVAEKFKFEVNVKWAIWELAKLNLLHRFERSSQILNTVEMLWSFADITR